MDNVVNFKKTTPFPDLWPVVNYDVVVYNLYRQLPVPMQAFTFALKSEIAGATFSVIVNPNNSIMYKTLTKRKSELEPFMRWMAINRQALQKLSEDGFQGTLVGRVATVDDREMFFVYYIIQGSEVTVDDRSIDKLLKLRQEDNFDGTLASMPLTRMANVTINKEEGSITCYDIAKGLNSTVIGIPVVRVERRFTEEGDEGAPPALFSTDVHMRYMAFICQGGAQKGIRGLA